MDVSERREAGDLPTPAVSLRASKAVPIFTSEIAALPAEEDASNFTDFETGFGF